MILRDIEPNAGSLNCSDLARSAFALRAMSFLLKITIFPTIYSSIDTFLRTDPDDARFDREASDPKASAMQVVVTDASVGVA